MKPKLDKAQSGFSLVEILIAVVILGIAAVVIIQGMSTDANVRGRNEDRISAFQRLVNGAELVSSKPFTSCASNPQENPYGLIPGITDREKNDGTITKAIVVEYLNASGVWTSCTQSATSGFSDIVQKITLKVWDDLKQVEQKREILKTFKGSSGSGEDDLPDPFIITASKSNLKVSSNSISSCGNQDSFQLSNSLDLAGVVYQPIVKSGDLSSSWLGGNTVRVTGGATSGMASLTVVGINPLNGAISNELNINVTVLGSFGFNDFPSETSFFVASLPRSNSSRISLPVNASAATTANLEVDFVNTSDTSDFVISKDGSSGTNVWWLNSRSSAPARSLSDIRLRLTHSELPQTYSDANCSDTNWRLPAQINPRLKFSIDNTSSGCLLSANTNLACQVRMLFQGASGSGENLVGISPTNGISTSTNMTNNTFNYTGNITINASSACTILRDNSTGNIDSVFISGGKFGFKLKGNPGTVLLNQTLNIKNSKSGVDGINWSSNGAKITGIDRSSFVDFTLVTTDFIAPSSSFPGGIQGKFQIIPLFLPSYFPGLVDTNFGNPYSVTADNEILNIKCSDNFGI